MSSPQYPDRAQWPGYWRGIRRAVVWLVVSIGAALVLVDATDRLHFLDQPWRLVLLFTVAILIGVVAERLIEWLARRWDDHLGASG